MLKKVKRRAKIALKRAKKRDNPFIPRHSRKEARHWLERRRLMEKIFRRSGFAAILVSLLFLGSMLFNIITDGYSAFTQTQIKLQIAMPQEVDATTDYRKIVHDSISLAFPDVTERQEKRELTALLSKGAYYKLRAMTLEDSTLAGKNIDLWLPAASAVDLQMKGAESEKISETQKAWLQQLQTEKRLRKSFNSEFFTHADSQEPEQAGIAGSLAGSFFMIAVCILCAFPLGVATALYLEEFARKNWFSELVEININNLAAVPSIIYGLLGLSVYISFLGMPRSSALVGGLVMALLVLPVIVIATRNALRSVPKAIRFAALAMGATPVQVALHHTLLYALPGIMTGVILSIARALGETSPLLMIGMVAFITDVPKKLTDPATTLPVQIYLWSNNPEAGFVEKTAAAIIMLLVILAVVNAAAGWVRRRFEIQW